MEDTEKKLAQQIAEKGVVAGKLCRAMAGLATRSESLARMARMLFDECNPYSDLYDGKIKGYVMLKLCSGYAEDVRHELEKLDEALRAVDALDPETLAL